jgi:hypothetical protein
VTVVLYVWILTNLRSHSLKRGRSDYYTVCKDTDKREKSLLETRNE